MSHTNRTCAIAQLTAEAKEALQELQLERDVQRLEQLLELARQDPIAPYRTKKWHPRFVVWELTLACNMQCKHCGSAAGKPRPDELSLDEMLRVCDELAELECERLTLLGGEPLIHPHWQEIAGRINANGFRVNVITNGWTLHREKLCDQIKEAGLSIVGISVDGLAASHDGLRCRPGSFDRIMRGIDLLKQREVAVAVTTVITNDSLDDLEELYQLLLAKRVRVWQLQIGNPLGRLDRDNPLIIKPQRLPELFEFIMQKRALADDIRIDIADNVGYYTEYEDRGVRQKAAGMPCHWTGCHAGIQSMGLDSNGDVKGCQSLPSAPGYLEGNVRQRSLKEIWNDPQAFRYTRQFQTSTLRGFCARCRYGPLCKGGCTSASIAHTGEPGDNPMCIYRFQQGG
jgi:radical SAM protein with 4Fe4S-binding SPASM domain